MEVEISKECLHACSMYELVCMYAYMSVWLHVCNYSHMYVGTYCRLCA